MLYVCVCVLMHKTESDKMTRACTAKDSYLNNAFGVTLSCQHSVLYALITFQKNNFADMVRSFPIKFPLVFKNVLEIFISIVKQDTGQVD